MTSIVYKEIKGVNVLGLRLEHNGIKGGDYSHGGYVKLQMFNVSNTFMQVDGKSVESFELMMRGDSERTTLIEALKVIIKELE